MGLVLWTPRIFPYFTVYESIVYLCWIKMEKWLNNCDLMWGSFIQCLSALLILVTALQIVLHVYLLFWDLYSVPLCWVVVHYLYSVSMSFLNLPSRLMWIQHDAGDWQAWVQHLVLTLTGWVTLTNNITPGSLSFLIEVEYFTLYSCLGSGYNMCDV